MLPCPVIHLLRQGAATDNLHLGGRSGLSIQSEVVGHWVNGGDGFQSPNPVSLNATLGHYANSYALTAQAGSPANQCEKK